jgi:predicted NAD/FAD-binding protein
MIEAPIDADDPQIVPLEFFSYLSQRNYSDTFIYKFLFPSLASTVCTCSYESLKRFPTGIMLKAMLLLTNREALFRARNGSADVAERLTRRLNDIHFDAAVRSAAPTETCVRIKLESGKVIDADHLIIATQANSAAKILPASSTKEEAMLKCFAYEDIEIVLHHDESLMPIRKSDWSNFNLMFEETKQSSMCSVWLNRFYPDWQQATPIFQTIMPFVEAASDKVVCRRRLQRPVVNRESLHGLELLDQLHRERERRIWFCGSYASHGVPLLESGVVSAMSVVNAMHVALPDSWQVGAAVTG